MTDDNFKAIIARVAQHENQPRPITFHAAGCPADGTDNPVCACGLWRTRIVVLENEVARLRKENEQLNLRISSLQHHRH